MKGIIFNILETLVVQHHDAATWDALLQRARLTGSYTAIGTYDDGEFRALLAEASTALGVPVDDLLRWYGRHAIPLFAERYPHFFAGHTSARSFVLTLNDIIHPEVRKLYPGADVPEFAFTGDGEALEISYRSSRRLCALAEGLLTGAADHFGETITVEQPECMNRGEHACRLVCRFDKAVP